MSFETPVHDAFGLTYASWFVAPRVILEAMPVEWQKKFVNLMEEMNDEFDWEPDCEMIVQFKKSGKFIKMPERFNNYRRSDRNWLQAIRTKHDTNEKAK